MPTVEEYIKERRDVIRQEDQRYVLKVATDIVKSFNEAVEREIRSNEHGSYLAMGPYQYVITDVSGMGYSRMGHHYRFLFKDITTKVRELLTDACSGGGAEFETSWELQYNSQIIIHVRPFWNAEAIRMKQVAEEMLAMGEAAMAAKDAAAAP
jgi:hypothetical protein